MATCQVLIPSDPIYLAERQKAYQSRQMESDASAKRSTETTMADEFSMHPPLSGPLTLNELKGRVTLSSKEVAQPIESSEAPRRTPTDTDDSFLDASPETLALIHQYNGVLRRCDSILAKAEDGFLGAADYNATQELLLEAQLLKKQIEGEPEEETASCNKENRRTEAAKPQLPKPLGGSFDPFKGRCLMTPEQARAEQRQREEEAKELAIKEYEDAKRKAADQYTLCRQGSSVQARRTTPSIRSRWSTLCKNPDVVHGRIRSRAGGAVYREIPSDAPSRVNPIRAAVNKIFGPINDFTTSVGAIWEPHKF